MRIQNYPGIATDPFGYAVVPYLTTYQENRLSVDNTTQLPDNVDLEQTTQFVVPNRGAMVAARFNANIGYRVLVTVSDRNGKPLPFGALASNDDTGQQSIVDEGGILYLSGYRVNHKAGLYAGEIRQINNVSLLSVHRIQNLQPLYYKAQRSAIKDKKMKIAPL